MTNTEHQKKLITSSERHSLIKVISKAFKCLIIGHRLAILVLTKHISTNVWLSINGVKCSEIERGQFSKITETACLSGWEFEADNSPYGVYATRHWNWVNSYWMFWIGRLCGARSVSSFCDFQKITFRDLTAFSSFLMQENLMFFRYSY